MTNVATIHYIDAGDFYSVYGISTLIVVILLMWYFVRSNIDAPGQCASREGLGGIPIEDPKIMAFTHTPDEDYAPIKITPDGKEKPYTFWAGTYGGVPLNVYDVKNLMYKPEWDHNTAMYIPNMRTVYRQTYTPLHQHTQSQQDQSQ